MASSKLFSDVALISLILATDINPPDEVQTCVKHTSKIGVLSRRSSESVLVDKAAKSAAKADKKAGTLPSDAFHRPSSSGG